LVARRDVACGSALTYDLRKGADRFANVLFQTNPDESHLLYEIFTYYPPPGFNHGGSHTFSPGPTAIKTRGGIVECSMMLPHPVIVHRGCLASDGEQHGMGHGLAGAGQ